jgi:hypothetical protein
MERATDSEDDCAIFAYDNTVVVRHRLRMSELRGRRCDDPCDMSGGRLRW